MKDITFILMTKTHFYGLIVAASEVFIQYPKNIFFY